MKQYQNELGTVFAVRELPSGKYRILYRENDGWAMASDPALSAVCSQANSLQTVLDAEAKRRGWSECKPERDPCDGCRCKDCGDTTCPQSRCDGANHGLGCNAPDSDCPTQAAAQPGEVYKAPGGALYKIAEKFVGKKRYYHTARFDPRSCQWEAANSSIYETLESAQGEFDAWIRTEKLVPAAPTGAAAATTDTTAANSESPSEIATISDAGTLPAPALPAENGLAQSAYSATAPVTSETESGMKPATPAFDYTGLDAQTVEYLRLAEREYAQGKIWAERGLRRMADGVAIAHEALCGSSSQIATSSKHNNQYSDDTFRAWCAFIGISKDTAYRLLQVSELYDRSTPHQQAVLEQLAPSLLYAAAKPSAPAELVQGVKDGSITTHKQYQALLAELQSRDAKIQELAAAGERADRRTDAAEREAKDAKTREEQAREAARKYREQAEALNAARNALLDEQDAYRRQAADAEKLADQRGSENADLRRKLREAESRPVDIAVAEPGEADKERWRKEGEERMAATLKDAVRRANKARLEAQSQAAELQNQLAAARPDADACQRTVDTLYETTENLRLLLRTQLRLAQLAPATYGSVTAHLLQAADALRDTVRSCAPAGYTMDEDEEDFL